MDQQNIPPQQQNKGGVFMDLETVIEVRDSLNGYAILAFLIFIVSVIGIGIVNNIVSQITFVFILILSIIAMVTAFDSYSKLDDSIPKVKKTVKEIICYEDGQTEEKEHEC